MSLKKLVTTLGRPTFVESVTKGKVSPIQTGLDYSYGHYKYTISRTSLKVLDKGMQKRQATIAGYHRPNS